MTEYLPHPLRILSFGAGAIGTYIGGSLALANQKVVYLERPEVALKLRQKGLHLQIGGQEHHLSAPKVITGINKALEIDTYDLAVFALKSFDTAAAIQEMQAYKADLPPILCLQNGVDNEPRLAEALGPDKVIAGTVTSAIGRRGIGEIVLERQRGVGIASGHVLSKVITAIFNQANLNARLYARAADMKWSKMLTNLLGNATSAILNLTPKEVFAHSALCRLEIRQLREALQVMAAQAIQVVDLPGTPVRALTFALQYFPSGLAQILLKSAVGSGRGGKMPSFHIDLHSGRGQTEVDYLNGAVVRHGAAAGIPTPVNNLLNQTLLELASGAQAIEDYSRKPEALLALLK